MSKSFSSSKPSGDYFGADYSTSKTSSSKPNGMCYESHPPLPVGDGLFVYGGSCGHPKHEDADIYIALQAGSTSGLAKYPWEDTEGPLEVEYSITDMSIPRTPGHFKKMIHWMADQIRDGKKVHVGCIGGHGRTGTVFAALVSVMLPEEPDAIGYVRKNYCDRAVESKKQVDFLSDHFGVKKVSGYKEGWDSPKKGSNDTWGYGDYSTSSKSPPFPKAKGVGSSGGQKSLAFSNAGKQFRPAPSKRNIWGASQKTVETP